MPFGGKIIPCRVGTSGKVLCPGDRVAACIAAASVLAKVTRDRIMRDLHQHWPAYDFDVHKGYVTDLHNARLAEHGRGSGVRHRDREQAAPFR